MINHHAYRLISCLRRPIVTNKQAQQSSKKHKTYGVICIPGRTCCLTVNHALRIDSHPSSASSYFSLEVFSLEVVQLAPTQPEKHQIPTVVTFASQRRYSCFLTNGHFRNSKALFICSEHAPNNIQTTIEVAEKVMTLFADATKL